MIPTTPMIPWDVGSHLQVAHALLSECQIPVGGFPIHEVFTVFPFNQNKSFQGSDVATLSVNSCGEQSSTKGPEPTTQARTG